MVHSRAEEWQCKMKECEHIVHYRQVNFRYRRGQRKVEDESVSALHGIGVLSTVPIKIPTRRRWDCVTITSDVDLGTR